MADHKAYYFPLKSSCGCLLFLWGILYIALPVQYKEIPNNNLIQNALKPFSKNILPP